LSAAFVWERLVRVNQLPSPVRYVLGGWSSLVERLERRARTLGVAIETGARVDLIPEPPVIVATELENARQLLTDDRLRWEGAHTVLLDVGMRRARGDPDIVYDLEDGGFAERFSAHDPALAPRWHELIQAQIGVRPGEPRITLRTDSRMERDLRRSTPFAPDRSLPRAGTSRDGASRTRTGDLLGAIQGARRLNVRVLQGKL
jgi:hypothetical protein